jgi:hypothetical protein
MKPSTPNLDAASAVQYSKPTSLAEEEIVTMCPERCLRMMGSTARVTSAKELLREGHGGLTTPSPPARLRVCGATCGVP